MMQKQKDDHYTSMQRFSDVCDYSLWRHKYNCLTNILKCFLMACWQRREREKQLSITTRSSAESSAATAGVWTPWGDLSSCCSGPTCLNHNCTKDIPTRLNYHISSVIINFFFFSQFKNQFEMPFSLFLKLLTIQDTFSERTFLLYVEWLFWLLLRLNEHLFLKSFNSTWAQFMANLPLPGKVQN